MLLLSWPAHLNAAAWHTRAAVSNAASLLSRPSSIVRTPAPLALFRQVYVYAIVGRDFYKQFRVWIISFTKTVL